MRWVGIGLMVVAAAFAVGLAFGLFGFGGILAQEGEPKSTRFVDAEHPIPASEMNPVTVEVIEEVVTYECKEPATDAGSPVIPESGDYLFLPRVCRYYSLPDDVERVGRITFGTCNFADDCPVNPSYIYQRGEARILIDQEGRLFDGMEGGDASAFPFFTGQGGGNE